LILDEGNGEKMDNTTPKLMTAQQAIARYVHDGDCIAIGGFVTNRRPYTLVLEVIRQKKKDLYVEGGPSGGDIDMLIGAGCVKAIMVSYIANSGYSQVCRRFREAVENGTLLFEDYSLDVHTIAYHGAALGLSYVPVKNMLGSDLARLWGISSETRRKHPKLPVHKYIIQEDPFHPGDELCCIPTPNIDVALIHVQMASPGGIIRITGLPFQDIDIATAARHTIVTCEELADDEEMRKNPEWNSLPGLCIDAVVHAPFGAHPSQCYDFYDYDPQFFIQYDQASRTSDGFQRFLEPLVACYDHDAYLDLWGASHLESLKIKPGYGYRPGLRRK